MDYIKMLEQEQMKNDIPDFRPGDTVRVDVKIVEGGKERIQAFEGVVIKRRGGGLSETYTVRRVAYGVAVERCFPVHSPRVDKITVVSPRPVSEELNSTTCVSVSVRLPESKKCADSWSKAEFFQPFFYSD